MTTTTTTTHCSVRDGARRIEFEGRLLAEASSKRSSPRWTEMRLYRTDSEVFVLEKVGRSVVVHAPGCPEILPGSDLERFQEVHPGCDPADGNYWFCDTCGLRAAADLPSMLIESDRHWALVSPKPEDIVDALYLKKGGAKSLPRTSIDLLEAASVACPELRGTFLVQRI